MKPAKLYHGTNKRISGALTASERIDLAALSMFPFDAVASTGFEEDIAYICIWGTPEEFDEKDTGGFIYVLPGETFEKVGMDYESQSFKSVEPETVKVFESVIDGMMACGVQVYFIDDEATFDEIVANKQNRAPLLKTLVSENQDEEMNVREF